MMDLSAASQENKMSVREIAVGALRVILGLVFVVAGMAKMWDVYGFVTVVKSFQMLPQSLVVSVSVIIPFAELVFGVMLIMNYRPRLSGLLLLVMLVIFTGFSAVKYLSGSTADCGCFGNFVSRRIDLSLFLQNLAIMVALVVIAVAGRFSRRPALVRPEQLDQRSNR